MHYTIITESHQKGGFYRPVREIPGATGYEARRRALPGSVKQSKWCGKPRMQSCTKLLQRSILRSSRSKSLTPHKSPGQCPRDNKILLFLVSAKKYYQRIISLYLVIHYRTYESCTTRRLRTGNIHGMDIYPDPFNPVGKGEFPAVPFCSQDLPRT